MMEEFYKTLDKLYDGGNPADVECFLLGELKEISTKNNAEANVEKIACYNELGSLYRGLRRYDESYKAFDNARCYGAETFGENSIEYGNILNNMAGTLRLMKDYDNALVFFHQAMDCYRACKQEQSYVYASALNNISHIYREFKDYNKALSYLNQALEIIKRDPEHIHEIGTTYSNLAGVYEDVGDIESALDMLEKARKTFDTLYGSDDENTVAAKRGIDRLRNLQDQ